eukprot:9478601-Pyramimonas_sp.AAC.1
MAWHYPIGHRNSQGGCWGRYACHGGYVVHVWGVKWAQRTNTAPIRGICTCVGGHSTQRGGPGEGPLGVLVVLGD